MSATLTRSAGYGLDAAGHSWVPMPENLAIDWVLCHGDFAENERELRHLSDDQAICVGYALRSPETDYLPPAHWLARRIGRELARLRVERGAGQIGPDGKVIVHGARTGRNGAFRPELVSVSLNHHEQSDWLLLRRVVEEAVETACAGMALPEIEMNGAGMFVAGGPNGDNGLSGKKLVVDAYGPGVPIGGGAWSGKDFFKVDRLGGMAARRLALESLLASDADEALVTLTYLPGAIAPPESTCCSMASPRIASPSRPLSVRSKAAYCTNYSRRPQRAPSISRDGGISSRGCRGSWSGGSSPELSGVHDAERRATCAPIPEPIMPDTNNTTSAFQLLLTPEKAALVAEARDDAARAGPHAGARFAGRDRSSARRCIWRWCSTARDR